MADKSTYVPRLKQVYDSDVRPTLHKEFGYGNVMQIPRLTKVVLNMGVGDAVQDSKRVTAAAEELTQISGQRAVKTLARNSVASFKIREGQAIGAKVTLRGARMFEFLDRLINIALPRVRDFRGVSPKAFDGRGNYSLGIKEHIVFPEINFDKVDKIRGFNVVVCTTANTDDEARALLKGMNFPFRT